MKLFGILLIAFSIFSFTQNVAARGPVRTLPIETRWSSTQHQIRNDEYFCDSDLGREAARLQSEGCTILEKSKCRLQRTNGWFYYQGVITYQCRY